MRVGDSGVDVRRRWTVDPNVASVISRRLERHALANDANERRRVNIRARLMGSQRVLRPLWFALERGTDGAEYIHSRCSSTAYSIATTRREREHAKLEETDAQHTKHTTLVGFPVRTRICACAVCSIPLCNISTEISVSRPRPRSGRAMW